MRRRASVAFALAAVALLALPIASRGEEPEPPLGVVDLHVDLPWKVHFKGRDIALPEGHATNQPLRDGHYIGIVLPIYLPDKAHKDGPHIADADAIFATINRITEKNPLFLPLMS